MPEAPLHKENAPHCREEAEAVDGGISVVQHRPRVSGPTSAGIGISCALRRRAAAAFGPAILPHSGIVDRRVAKPSRLNEDSFTLSTAGDLLSVPADSDGDLMSATAYTPDLRDISFVMHEVIRAIDVLHEHGVSGEVDRELMDSTIAEAARVATDLLGPINGPGDREGCHLQPDGTVRVPAGYSEVYPTFVEGGWQAMSSPVEYGGMGLPQVLGAAVGELMTGACPAFAMYPGLTRGAANLLAHFAPDHYRTMVCEKMFTGEWGGTMCLTEPGAGSSVGDARTRATPTGTDGVYLIEGEKIFISSGDHPLTENIVHLVLARTPGAPAGTRGLSIFLVPKFEFDFSDGTLGARNGVYVEKIEEKMGIHGNSTCALSFGARAPCRGWLLGEEGQGMKIMFHMMNEARLEVGIQGLSGAASAYHNALAYAKGRVQGQSIDEFGDASAKSVAIIEHPDVRRMLMWQKVHVEGLRMMVLDVALQLDKWEALEHADEVDKDALRTTKGFVELMTPIVKSYGSDKGYEVTVSAIQTFGGYGFIGEYPVEQIARDTKIASIYEGTNGIQAMDLLGRKMAKGSGILFMNWMGEATATLERVRQHTSLAESVASIEKARDSLGASAMHLAGLGMAGDRKGAMAHATSFLNQFGNVLLAVYHARAAAVAVEALAGGDLSESETRFYKGKLVNLRFYVGQVLPESFALGKVIRSGDASCMDEDAFA